jgi:hypothetical protein
MRTRFGFIVIIGIIFLAGISFSDAVDSPDAARGFKGPIDFNGLDNINMLNGNLVVMLPIGPSYKVGPLINFQLKLINNSKIWEPAIFDTDLTCDDPGNPDYPPRSTSVLYGPSTIGVGWRLDLGHLELAYTGDPSEPQSGDPAGLLISEDGSRHEFYYEDKELWGFAYTQDGTFMKLKRTGPKQWVVQMGNGITYTYDWEVPAPTDSWEHGPDFIQGEYGHYVTNIHDPFGNSLDIAYYAGTPRIEKISFTLAGSPQRTAIKFDYDSAPPMPSCSLATGWYNYHLLSKISFMKDAEHSNDYLFTYEFKNLQRPDCPIINDGYCACKKCIEKVQCDPSYVVCKSVVAPTLSSVIFPDGMTYSFEYMADTDINQDYSLCGIGPVPIEQDISDPGTPLTLAGGDVQSAPGEDVVGSIKSIHLPTGGSISYLYKTTRRRFLFNCPNPPAQENINPNTAVRL